jgi:hypothetical protein
MLSSQQQRQRQLSPDLDVCFFFCFCFVFVFVFVQLAVHQLKTKDQNEPFESFVWCCLFEKVKHVGSIKNTLFIEIAALM